MSHKPAQLGKIAFAVLCLQLSTAIARNIEYAEGETFTGQDLLGHTYVAPQMLDDRKYATMTFRYDPGLRRTVLSVKVVGPNYVGRKCILPQSVKPTLSDSINRVSRKTAVLTIYALNERVHFMPWKLLLVNTDDCAIRYAYDATLPFGKLHVLTSNNSTDERFTVITHGKNFLFGEPEWSRLFCDPICRRREAVDFHSSWLRFVSIELATDSIDADLFIVQVIDQTYAISVRLYDLSNDRTGQPFKELLTWHPLMLHNVETISNGSTHATSYKMCKVASAGLSHCLRPLKSVHNASEPLQCLRFWENGTVMFNETVRGYEFPIHVQTIPNGFVLFGNKTYCEMANSCSAVQVAMVTRNSDPKIGVVQFQRREYQLKCPIMPSSLRVQLNEATNSIKYIEYLCQHDFHVDSRIIYEP